MLKTRVIPCLDVKNGRTVKGVNFVDLMDAGDPVEQARVYQQQGADELCFLDITATHENRGLILDIISKVATECFMPLTVGGGVRELTDIDKLLKSGADKVGINSAAIKNPDFVKKAADKYGNQCIVVAVDAKLDKSDNIYKIYTHGGRNNTQINAIEWAKKMANYGAGEILLTSMDNDGTKSGFNLDLTKKVSEAVNIPVIASGGVGTLEHFSDGIIKGKANAVLAASVFHFGKYTISEVKQHMQRQGIEVRI